MKSDIPIAAKKFQIYVSYKYGPTIGQSLFNHNKVLSTITKNHDGLPVCDCTDNFPNFVYKPHGHVHTGNLDLIDNTQLRSLMKKGAKFRETPSCSKYKLDHLYQDAIDKLTTKLAGHSKSKSGIFYHWKDIILQEIKLILKQLPSKFPSSQILNRPEVIKYIQYLDDRFVIVQVDKASNNLGYCVQEILFRGYSKGTWYIIQRQYNW